MADTGEWRDQVRTQEDDLVRQLLESNNVDEVIARLEGDHYRHLSPVIKNLSSFDRRVPQAAPAAAAAAAPPPRRGTQPIETHLDDDERLDGAERSPSVPFSNMSRSARASQGQRRGSSPTGSLPSYAAGPDARTGRGSGAGLAPPPPSGNRGARGGRPQDLYAGAGGGMSAMDDWHVPAASQPYTPASSLSTSFAKYVNRRVPAAANPLSSEEDMRGRGHYRTHSSDAAASRGYGDPHGIHGPRQTPPPPPPPSPPSRRKASRYESAHSYSGPAGRDAARDDASYGNDTDRSWRFAASPAYEPSVSSATTSQLYAAENRRGEAYGKLVRRDEQRTRPATNEPDTLVGWQADVPVVPTPQVTSRTAGTALAGLEDPSQSRIARQLQLLRNYRQLAELCAQTNDPGYNLFSAIPPEQLARMQQEQLQHQLGNLSANGRETSPVMVNNNYYFSGPPPPVARTESPDASVSVQSGASARERAAPRAPNLNLSASRLRLDNGMGERLPTDAFSPLTPTSRESRTQLPPALSSFHSRPPLQSPQASSGPDSPLAMPPLSPPSAGLAANEKSAVSLAGAGPFLSPAPSPPQPASRSPRGKSHKPNHRAVLNSGGDYGHDTPTATTEEAGTSYGEEEEDDEFRGDFLDEDEDATFLRQQPPRIIEREQHRRFNTSDQPLPGTSNVTLNRQLGLTSDPTRTTAMTNTQMAEDPMNASFHSTPSGTDAAESVSRGSKAGSMINVLSGEKELLAGAVSAHRRSSTFTGYDKSSPALMGSAASGNGSPDASGTIGAKQGGRAPRRSVSAGGSPSSGRRANAGGGRPNAANGQDSTAGNSSPPRGGQQLTSTPSPKQSVTDVGTGKLTPERRFQDVFGDDLASSELDETPLNAQLQTHNPSASAARKQKLEQERRRRASGLAGAGPDNGSRTNRTTVPQSRRGPHGNADRSGTRSGRQGTAVDSPRRRQGRPDAGRSRARYQSRHHEGSSDSNEDYSYSWSSTDSSFDDEGSYFSPIRPTRGAAGRGSPRGNARGRPSMGRGASGANPQPGGRQGSTSPYGRGGSPGQSPYGRGRGASYPGGRGGRGAGAPYRGSANGNPRQQPAYGRGRGGRVVQLPDGRRMVVMDDPSAAVPGNAYGRYGPGAAAGQPGPMQQRPSAGPMGGSQGYGARPYGPDAADASRWPSQQPNGEWGRRPARGGGNGILMDSAYDPYGRPSTRPHFAASQPQGAMAPMSRAPSVAPSLYRGGAASVAPSSVGHRSGSVARLQPGLLYGSLLPKGRPKTAMVIAPDEQGHLRSGGVNQDTGDLLPLPDNGVDDDDALFFPEATAAHMGPPAETSAIVGDSRSVQQLVWKSGSSGAVMGRNQRIPTQPHTKLSSHYRQTSPSTHSNAAFKPLQLTGQPPARSSSQQPQYQRVLELQQPSTSSLMRQQLFQEQQQRQQQFLQQQRALEDQQQVEQQEQLRNYQAAGTNASRMRLNTNMYDSRQSRASQGMAQANAQRFGITALSS